LEPQTGPTLSSLPGTTPVGCPGRLIEHFPPLQPILERHGSAPSRQVCLDARSRIREGPSLQHRPAADRNWRQFVFSKNELTPFFFLLFGGGANPVHKSNGHQEPLTATPLVGSTLSMPGGSSEGTRRSDHPAEFRRGRPREGFRRPACPRAAG